MTRHAFTNPKADGGDTTVVRPIDWNAGHVAPVVTVSGTTHTTVVSDAGKLLRCTSASPTVVTVDNLTEGQWVDILAAGSGAVSVAAGSGWTVEPAATLNLNGQWAMGTVYCDAASHAVLTGYIV